MLSIAILAAGALALALHFGPFEVDGNLEATTSQDFGPANGGVNALISTSTFPIAANDDPPSAMDNPAAPGIATLFYDPISTSSLIDDSIFTEGSKETTESIPDPPPAGGITDWVIVAGNVPPNKDDLSLVYTWVDQSFENLVLAMERLNINGDSHVDFALDHKPWEPCPNDPDSLCPNRTEGDLLLAYDLTNGGAVVEARLFLWEVQGGADVGAPFGAGGTTGCDGAITGGGNLNKSCVGGKSGADEYGWEEVPIPAGSIEQLINTTEIPAGDWGSFGKGGAPRTTIPPFGFFEVYINLADLGFVPVCPVLGTASVRSRSSDSIDAALKDLAGPIDLGVDCDARISIAPDATNEVGTDHVLTVTVEKLDPSTGFVFAPAENVDVTTSLMNSNGATASFVGGIDMCMTDAAGECTVAISSPTAGTTEVSATADVDVVGDTITVTTDGVEDNSPPAVKTWVDAKIAISPDDTNEVNDAHEFTVNVMKDEGDGAGFVAAEGVTVVVSFPGGAPGTVDDSDCADGTDASGNCVVTVNSAVAGVFTAHAAANVSVGGLSLPRETDGMGNNSGDATKTYVDAFITIETDDTNEVNESHTFVVHIEKDPGTGSVPAAGIVPVISFPDGTPDTVDTSDCDAGTDAAGNCDVLINSSVAGTFSVHAAAEIPVGGLTLARETDGMANNGDDAVKIYVDAKISIAPDDVNGIGEEHTFTVNVMKDEGDGSGFVGAAGVIPVITFPGGAPGTVDTSDCDAGTDASGDCDVTINSDVAGTFTAHASATITVGGIMLDRETDGMGNNSGDATKTYVAGMLSWEKRSSTGDLLGGATFEVCRTHAFDSATSTFVDIADECDSVLDNNPPDTDPADGLFKLVDLALGRYTIEETMAPSGFAGDPFIETIELTVSSPNGVAMHVWINTPTEGCTPGFWKNHTELWDGGCNGGNPADDVTTTIQTCDLFNATFGVTSLQSGLSDATTLFEALSVSGSTLQALNRHASAALVNADSPVASGFSVAGVISLYRDAVGADPGPETVDSALATLSTSNERGCPLN